jgi:two-component system chemotaxis response regulator CheY
MPNSIKPSVLLVDDNSLIRDVLRIILRSDGYKTIVEASNGQQAIAQCKKHNPGLVLLDINMPKMDGLQALKAIRNEFPTTKVLMVSAESTMDKVLEAISLGASGFVVKPLNQANVLDSIGMALKKE